MKETLWLKCFAAAMLVLLAAGCPTDPVLDVSPASRTVGAPAGTTTFAVSMDGVGVVAWTPTVTAGEEWLYIDSATSDTLTVGFDANATPDAREGEITIDAGDVEGSPAVVAVVQSGVTGQGDIDLVGSWNGNWWINGIEQNTDIGWTFDTDGTWVTWSVGHEATGTYVVDNAAYPNKIDIYVITSDMGAYTVGTVLRGYYQVVGSALYHSQMFEARLPWSSTLFDPENATVFVADAV